MERHFVFIATYLLIFHLVQAQNQTGMHKFVVLIYISVVQPSTVS